VSSTNGHHVPGRSLKDSDPPNSPQLNWSLICTCKASIIFLLRCRDTLTAFIRPQPHDDFGHGSSRHRIRCSSIGRKLRALLQVMRLPLAILRCVLPVFTAILPIAAPAAVAQTSSVDVAPQRTAVAARPARPASVLCLSAPVAAA
jgi:hypothetical protein